VIDDDASYRTAVERRLKWAGYDVETYSSAQQLLDRLPGADTPGCILLDVQMPGLSGLELQNRLESGSTLPIVFVTGYADAPTIVQAMKAGAEDFLTKPASSQQLIDAIERAMARYGTALHHRSEFNSLLQRCHKAKWGRRRSLDPNQAIRIGGYALCPRGR
jgi:FixJ family two-component response regulator